MVPGTVGIRVRTGSRWNCTRFGPATIVKQQPVPTVTLVARGALASGVADCSAASLR